MLPNGRPQTIGLHSVSISTKRVPPARSIGKIADRPESIFFYLYFSRKLSRSSLVMA